MAVKSQFAHEKLTKCDIIVAGAGGRMGRAITKSVLEAKSSGFTLVGGFDRSGSPDIGKDMGVLAGLGEVGMKIQSGLNDIKGSFDTKTSVLVDFTVPQACLAHAKFCADVGIAHVIGATGFTEQESATLKAIAVKTPTVKSGNMSMGVTLLAVLVEQAAAKLNDSFDIEINEAHHRLKVDAPSGTALLLGDAAAKGRGVDLGEKSIRGRDGITGERKKGDIGFSVIRGGGIIGDHEAMFISGSEIITLSHHAVDRQLFAEGALRAASWLVEDPKNPKVSKDGMFYSMRDVLGI